MDSDHIISGLFLVVAGMLGGALFMIMSIRDKVSILDKRLNLQTQKLTRLLEWVDGNKVNRN